jgi:hypothetical protein
MRLHTIIPRIQKDYHRANVKLAVRLFNYRILIAQKIVIKKVGLQIHIIIMERKIVFVVNAI